MCIHHYPNRVNIIATPNSLHTIKKKIPRKSIYTTYSPYITYNAYTTLYTYTRHTDAKPNIPRNIEINNNTTILTYIDISGYAFANKYVNTLPTNNHVKKVASDA